MLRFNQTQNLSSRVSKLFEFSGAKLKMQSQSIPMHLCASAIGYSSGVGGPQPSIVKRRRLRRAGQFNPGGSGNIRASWF